MPIKSLLRGAKTAVTGKKAAPEKTRPVAESAPEGRIDFPKESEKVASGHYAVRISAPKGWDVEINAGGTEWWGCREAVGFYWFDWWPAKPGRTTLSIRVKSGKGRWKKVSERACTVTVGNAN